MAAPMATDGGGVGGGCIYNYHVTAHKPTAVRHCAVGSFTSPADINLIIGRSTHLEIQTLTPEGLKGMLTVPLYGVLSALKLFRPKSAAKDLLLLLTEHYKLALLEAGPPSTPGGAPELLTRATADVRDVIGRPVEAGQLAAIDPDCRVIALHLYDGQLKVLLLQEGAAAGQVSTPSGAAAAAPAPLRVAPETFNVRLEELMVIDMTFLATGGGGSGAASSSSSGASDNPVLALLYEDNKGARHVRTYTLNLRTKELDDGPWAQGNLDAGSSKVVPVPQPLGGAIVLGESVVSYFAAQQPTRSTQIRPNTAIQSWCAVDADGSRYLLSDFAGGLHLLVLAHADNRVAGLKVQTLGRTTSTSCMAYLDSGYVFLGSKGGDSQLIRLHAEPLPLLTPGAAPASHTSEDAAAAGGASVGVPGGSAAGAAAGSDDAVLDADGAAAAVAAAAAAAAGGGAPNYVEVVDSWQSLAPIVDLVVMDLERQGQGQMVACCGVFQDGSLRVVRNGVGIHEAAAMELPGIKGMWRLRSGWLDAYDSHLVLSFVGETRLLAISEDDVLDEAVLPGIDGTRQTLLAATTLHDQLLQVTSGEVRLINSSGNGLLASWKPATATHNASPGGSITLAAASPCQVLLSGGGGRLWLLECTQDGQLVEVAGAVMEAEVACLDVTPVDAEATRASLAAVGTWAMQVCLMRLPDLSIVAAEALQGEVIPRSVALADFEGQAYLLCGMGDGQLHNWRLDPAAQSLNEHKKVVLGTKPILLSPFVSGGQHNIFAASDRPTIVYSSNRKLLYSNINENEVTYLCSYSTPSFPDSLALVKGEQLSLGTIDGIQKLHIRTVPLGEQPRRIAAQAETKSLGVATISTPTSNSPGDVGRSHFRIFSDTTFDLLASYALAPSEIPTAVASIKLGGASTKSDTAAAAAAEAAGGSSSSDADAAAVYYAVGTAIIKPNEVEPSKGHVLLLSFSPASCSLTLVEQLEVHGAVYNLAVFQGKLLATVNNRVHLYRWAPSAGGRNELVSDCSPVSVQVLCLHLAVRGDLVVVGDLMNSVSVLEYKAAEGALELRARDQESKWLTALALLDDATYIAADNSSNLVVVRRNAEALTDEESARLEVVGRFHTGEFVNRLRAGSLVMRLQDSELADVPTFLYGGVNGAIGLIASLPRELFEMLAQLQDGLRKVVRGVGGFDHESWRRFKDERHVYPSSGFIDGDLVEALLDLPPAKAREVVAAVWPNGEHAYEDVCRRVEELQRLH